jgi:hypothetical protein
MEAVMVGGRGGVWKERVLWADVVGVVEVTWTGTEVYDSGAVVGGGSCEEAARRWPGASMMVSGEAAVSRGRKSATATGDLIAKVFWLERGELRDRARALMQLEWPVLSKQCVRAWLECSGYKLADRIRGAVMLLEREFFKVYRIRLLCR